MSIKGLDRIARYLINEALVTVDDMPNTDVPEKVENVIASLRARLAAADKKLEIADEICDAIEKWADTGWMDEKVHRLVAEYRKAGK